MGIRALRNELEFLEPHALIYHISEVYRRYPEVKEYFDFFLHPDEEKMLEKYKLFVHEGFYPTRGKRLKLGMARKAMSAFKKLAISPEAVAALLLYFSQVAVIYAREKRVPSESFYTRIETSFRSALEYMNKEGVLPDFEKETSALVERAVGLPWRCGDHLTTIRDSFY